MAGAQELLPLPYEANEALTKQRFVKLAGDEAVDMADTAGEVVIGVTRVSATADEATDGKVVAVDVLGNPWVEAGAAITRGAKVMTNAAGKAIAATATNVPVGIAMQAAAADGDLITVLLTPGLPAL